MKPSTSIEKEAMPTNDEDLKERLIALWQDPSFIGKQI